MAELSETDIARIARVVRRIEHEPYNALSDRPAPAGRGRQVDIVRTTSITPTSSRYPGKVQQYDSSAATWTDLGDAWLVDSEGTALALGYYPAVRYGDANGKPVFLTRTVSTGSFLTAPVATTNIAFSGARVRHSATQAGVSGNLIPNFDTEEFDTDSYHDTTTNKSQLTIPTDGYYMFGGSLLFSVTNVTGMSMSAWLNGATRIDSVNKLAAAGTVLTSSPYLELTSLYHFTAGDYIELLINYTGTTPSLTALTSTHEYPNFWITRLGA